MKHVRSKKETEDNGFKQSDWLNFVIGQSERTNKTNEAWIYAY